MLRQSEQSCEACMWAPTHPSMQQAQYGLGCICYICPILTCGLQCDRHLNGFADRPPVRPNMSLGDTLAGLHAAFGIVMALLHRQRHDNRVPGQVSSAASCYLCCAECCEMAITALRLNINIDARANWCKLLQNLLLTTYLCCQLSCCACQKLSCVDRHSVKNLMYSCGSLLLLN